MQDNKDLRDVAELAACVELGGDAGECSRGWLHRREDVLNKLCSV